MVAPEERKLAGIISGVLFGLGGVTLSLYLILPHVTEAHREVVVALSAAAVVWGVCSVFAVDWRDAPFWLIQAAQSAGLALIAVGVASTGGATSPAWVYLLLAAVFSAYFYRPQLARLYIAACVVVQLLPLLYDSRAFNGDFLAQAAVAAPAYVILGGAIMRSRRLMSSLRVRAEGLAAEQSALRRVATAVVDGQPPEVIYELAAREIAALLGAAAAGILRFDGPDSATVMGAWADRPDGRYAPGTEVPVKYGGDLATARQARIPVRIDDHPEDSPVGRLGYAASIVAPVHVAGETWGALAVAAAQPSLTRQDEEQLQAFGNLLATAIASIEDRAKLRAQASSDPLTGLANHRTLQSRLAAEVARATRHGQPLSVAVIDVDHFKHVNDSGGHEAGDDVLVRIARCLQRLARAEDTLGRVGGDEFAWILPQTNREQALVAVERARRVIATVNTGPLPISVSAGICDTTVTRDPAELIHLADGALYWSKAHGRNQSWIFDPQTINELSAQERAERLERSQSLLGLRALARAIDAKDPATKQHSERVAELAGKLARSAGWTSEQAGLLSQAALVHDVGKIGIPDEVLRKPAPLTPAERVRIAEHSEMSARIVEDVLRPEQVEWIRTHHERPDGTGYPDGLTADEIPEGGALLALADAWDVMTVSRPYGVPKELDTALAEVMELEGRQFTPAAVAAILQLYAAGELGPARTRATAP
jgi:diguanylate cyclase (GGDEF)-like protein/putative nucleotidyltransferase with HDIG domain